MLGTTVYNEAVRVPCCTYPTAAQKEEARRALEAQRQRETALLAPADGGDDDGEPPRTPPGQGRGGVPGAPSLDDLFGSSPRGSALLALRRK
jgi:hypothetical protein